MAPGHHFQNFNGHISVMGHPIYIMFGSGVGLSGSEDQVALLPVGSKYLIFSNRVDS